jgi:hypothetical protein
MQELWTDPELAVQPSPGRLWGPGAQDPSGRWRVPCGLLQASFCSIPGTGTTAPAAKALWTYSPGSTKVAVQLWPWQVFQGAEVAGGEYG